MTRISFTTEDRTAENHLAAILRAIAPYAVQVNVHYDEDRGVLT